MHKLITITAILLLSSCSQPQMMDLSGEWKIQIDRDDLGETNQWFTQKLRDPIQLPGSMASNGLGDDITLETEWMGGMRNPEWYTDPAYQPYHKADQVRFPYWLQPDKKYTGAAWYQKEVNIPAGWSGKSLELFLERVHWESTLWFDNREIGMRNSLGTPHVYTITGPIEPGKHLITIRVDNRMKDIDVGWDSHSVSDHTQSNWNGIVGDITLSPLGILTFGAVRISTDPADRTILITGDILRAVSEPVRDPDHEITASIEGRIKGENLDMPISRQEIRISGDSTRFTVQCRPEGDVRLWDEFDPHLYRAELSLLTDDVEDQFTGQFGFRRMEARPDGLYVNNRKTFLRGTLECAIFPLTGYPSTDPEEWKRIMDIVKDHGINHIRFHSWCPPRAAFIAADEKGVYLQVECSSWANSTTAIGNGEPIDQFIYDEARSIIDAYGNHPSFVMMAYGNEPGGARQGEFLTGFVTYWQQEDPRRIYTSAAGWPQLPVNDFHNIPDPRIQGWGEQLKSIINARPPSSAYDWSDKLKATIHKSRIPDPDSRIPVVSHEIGQWCVYPDFKEIAQYTGVLKAQNFEIFQESLEANGMGHLADSFLLASGKLQALCYKADIEAALRTPDFGGFQLLDLHDFPGQGTALVGILNPFWKEKGYISPAEFRQFCDTTVPLARLNKHLFFAGDTLEVPVQIAHFGKTGDLRLTTEIRLRNEDGTILVQETLEELALEIGSDNYPGTFQYRFDTSQEARKLTMEVATGGAVNSWSIFVYPRPDIVSAPHVATDVTPDVLRILEEGGQVLLSLGKGRVSQEWGGDVGVGFSSIFWNTAWTGGQKPHTLGILCNPDHPALADFPTAWHADWNWWDAMSQADAIRLDHFDQDHQPIVRIIDDWVTNRPLALILEARVGSGKIIVSGADLHNNLENRPAASQLRHSLLSYLESEACQPLLTLDEEDLIRLTNRR